jgi:antitoxin CptB
MAASNPTDPGSALALLDPQALGRLKWRCRRGLLENDLFVQRFFACHEAELTVRQADGLATLMDLADNDLLDLLLARRTDGPGTQTQEAREVLDQMRQAMANKA